MAMMRRDQKKGVWVAVYVERPKRRRLISNNTNQQHHHHHHLHHHHHHHHHLYVHRPNHASAVNGRSQGYNRKAQLLEYTRQLRDSAPSQASSPSMHPKPAPHSNHHQIVAVRNRAKVVRTPACLGNWKFLIPSFLRSFLTPVNKKKSKRTNNTAVKIKAVMKTLLPHKNRGNFVSKMFATMRKRG